MKNSVYIDLIMNVELTRGMPSLCFAICQHLSKLIVQDDRFPFSKFVELSTRPITSIMQVNVLSRMVGENGKKQITLHNGKH